MRPGKLHAAIALSLVMLFLSLPGTVLEAIQSGIAEIVGWQAELDNTSGLPTDKLVHILLFAWLAWSLLLGWPDRRFYGRIAAFLLFIALLSEGVQLLVPGRSADWLDVAADIVGAGFGLSGQHFLRVWRGKKKPG
tara:strand:- start:3599 stop:4006 length:408 start_codon:yes stop_codon:yes gene_type:complete